MHAVLRRPRGILGIAACLVVLLTVTAVLCTGSPAAAGPFVGAVLTSTTATLPADLDPLATGKRISYVTTSVTGSPVPATGLVLTPRTNKQNRVVVWGHGTTGLADRCAPSVSQTVFWPEARSAIADLLTRGFTVAAPDYPGLGTFQAHPYLIGGSAARSMIDSVKAARRLDSSLGVQYAVNGHSQGGQGALFAGEIADGYDGELELRAVAAIAPVSNADLFAPMIPGTPGQGYLVMGLFGLRAVDPSINPYALLAAPARQRTPVLHSGCLYEILDAYAPLTASELLVGGELPASVVAKLAHHDNPAQAPSSAPILLVQGTDDEAVPFDLTAGVLLPQLEAHSQPVTFEAVAGANHDGTVVETTDLVADWIADRLLP